MKEHAWMIAGRMTGRPLFETCDPLAAERAMADEALVAVPLEEWVKEKGKK